MSGPSSQRANDFSCGNSSAGRKFCSETHWPWFFVHGECISRTDIAIAENHLFLGNEGEFWSKHKWLPGNRAQNILSSSSSCTKLSRRDLRCRVIIRPPKFFITTAKCDFLDGKHVVFGKVVDGLLTLRKIENVATGPNNRPKLAVKITGVFGVYLHCQCRITCDG